MATNPQTTDTIAPLLRIDGLKTEFKTYAGTVRSVDDVSFSVRPGEVLGLVGESGCGKSVTALSIMGLIEKPGRIVAGSVTLAGHGELTTRSAEEMRKIRGDIIAMIFQEPMTSLNPVYRVGRQIAEAVRLHRDVSRAQADEQAVEMLNKVGIPAAAARAREFPHQLSGGMRQRVMIAMAMACQPRLLLADEPTTALDVTVQAQILDLMIQMQESEGTAIVLITHDMGVIAEMAHEVAVMYAGVIVEQADVATLFENPQHPYTQGLLASIPRGNTRGRELEVIAGLVPNLLRLPTGCRFRERCSQAHAACTTSEPPLTPADSAGHRVRCWLHQNAEAIA